jgi:hypothetical protein
MPAAWMELLSAFPAREGKYLIAPIHAETKQNYPLYRVLERVKEGDPIFHCILEKATNNPTAISSFSIAAGRFTIQTERDVLCSYNPPYRRVALRDNCRLNVPITIARLKGFAKELGRIRDETNVRIPFDKNLRLKQVYLSPLPGAMRPIFEEISETKFPQW